MGTTVQAPTLQKLSTKGFSVEVRCGRGFELGSWEWSTAFCALRDLDLGRVHLMLLPLAGEDHERACLMLPLLRKGYCACCVTASSHPYPRRTTPLPKQGSTPRVCALRPRSVSYSYMDSLGTRSGSIPAITCRAARFRALEPKIFKPHVLQ